MRSWAIPSILAILSLGAAASPSGLTPQAAFERLKGASGTWTGTIADDAGPAKVVYRTVANGSAVMETLFPGTPEEMISIYFVDGEELRMTHYCAVGNQPRLRLDRKASTADTLVFAFDGGTNFNPRSDMHIHSGSIAFQKDGSMVASWAFYKDGKEAGKHSMRVSEAAE